MKPIFLIGMPGVGKTTLGRKLSAHLAIPFIDLDEYIATQQGQSIPALFRAKGEDFFREAEAAALREVAAGAGGAVVATGGGTPCYRGNMDFMNAAGTTVFLQLPAETLAARLLAAQGRDQRPLVAGKSAAEIKQFVTETLISRLEFYQKAHVTFQNQNSDIADLCQLIQAV